MTQKGMEVKVMQDQRAKYLGERGRDRGAFISSS